MAVENDYNLLVQHLNWLAEQVAEIHTRVQARLLEEKRDSLEPNQTAWVNLLVQRLALVESQAHHLQDGAWQVLRSKPGEAVFPAQPPPAPDTPP
jgi:hypothetical protein